MEYDFSGYATKNDLRCSDGRIIRAGAFKNNNGKKVPLLWQHGHNDPMNVLGHAILENRADGVYAYCKLNDTAQGKNAKVLIQHGDVVALSIYANELKEQQTSSGKDVIHGNIRELSLVLSGANPGAFIDNVIIQHGDSETLLDSEAIIYTGLDISLQHSDSDDSESNESTDDSSEETENSSEEVTEEAETEEVSEEETEENDTDDDSDMEDDDLTINDVVHSMTDEQQEVLYTLLENALQHNLTPQDDGDTTISEIIHSMTDLQQAVVYKMLEGALEHAKDNNEGADVSTTATEDDDRTVKDVFDSLTEEQKNVVYYMIGEALEAAEADDDTDSDKDTNNVKHSQEGPNVQHNIFESTKGQTTSGAVLSHSDMTNIIKEAQRSGSFKDAVSEYALQHGIEDIDTLFPDAKAVAASPEFVGRRTEWVAAVMNGVRHTPFARIKSMTADITADEARAKGYIKGNFKKEEFFKVAKRVTTPTTVYKKQKLDRDDMVDITDFDVVAWLKGEMRIMLDEEVARAILLGDGRSAEDDDKINEENIRPIATDNELFVTTVYVNVDDANSSASEIVDTITLNRRHFRGSGTPVFFTTELIIAKLLLTKDTLGRRIYASVAELKDVLRVSDIVAVEAMETTEDVIGILVNLQDYTVGADKGGNVTMFDDFDIDYNAQKYLIETRLSGALIRPKAAIVVRKVEASAVLAVPVEPAFDGTEIEIPVVTGVVYKNKANGATVTGTVTLTAGQSMTVVASPAAGRYFADSNDDEWTFVYEA